MINNPSTEPEAFKSKPVKAAVDILHSKIELSLIAKLARHLILVFTTLAAEFPGYRYDKTD